MEKEKQIETLNNSKNTDKKENKTRLFTDLTEEELHQLIHECWFEDRKEEQQNSLPW